MLLCFTVAGWRWIQSPFKGVLANPGWDKVPQLEFYCYNDNYFIVFCPTHSVPYSQVRNNSSPPLINFLIFCWTPLPHPFLIWSPLLINFPDFVLQIFHIIKTLPPPIIWNWRVIASYLLEFFAKSSFTQ